MPSPSNSYSEVYSTTARRSSPYSMSRASRSGEDQNRARHSHRSSTAATPERRSSPYTYVPGHDNDRVFYFENPPTARTPPQSYTMPRTAPATPDRSPRESFIRHPVIVDDRGSGPRIHIEIQTPSSRGSSTAHSKSSSRGGSRKSSHTSHSSHDSTGSGDSARSGRRDLRTDVREGRRNRFEDVFYAEPTDRAAEGETRERHRDERKAREQLGRVMRSQPEMDSRGNAYEYLRYPIPDTSPQRHESRRRESSSKHHHSSSTSHRKSSSSHMPRAPSPPPRTTTRKSRNDEHLSSKEHGGLTDRLQALRLQDDAREHNASKDRRMQDRLSGRRNSVGTGSRRTHYAYVEGVSRFD